jgi:two-component system sensor histidine kinase DegS
MPQSNALDNIIEKTISSLEESKKDIFLICESARKEYDDIKLELGLLQEEISQITKNVKILERNSQEARWRLMEVSKEFGKYTEDDIKIAYEKAEEISVEMAVLREKQEQLEKRRQELENRLKSLEDTIKKAENLITKVCVIKDYLQGELTNISGEYDDLMQKHNMAIKVINAQEEERKRLAREIHDGPAQFIANLVFRVELTEKLLDKDIKRAREELEALKKMICAGMQDIRKIIYDLRPMSIDDLGLIPTVTRYINNFIERTGIDVKLDIRGRQARLDSTYEVTLFRLIQEALNNIYKHAEAKNARVRLEYGEESINLFISDDGIGFENKAIGEEQYGLLNMEERCRLLDGTIEIESAKNKGTTIKIMLPAKRGVKG